MEEFITGKLAYDDIQIVRQALVDFVPNKEISFDMNKEVDVNTESRRFDHVDGNTYVIRINESDLMVEVIYIRVYISLDEDNTFEVRSSNGK